MLITAMKTFFMLNESLLYCQQTDNYLQTHSEIQWLTA